MKIFDLHTHSLASDGDLSARDIVLAAKQKGLAGISLTDHNGVWECDEARSMAAQEGMEFIEGIEVTARFGATDVHVLGYSASFDRKVLTEGLAQTRQGYEDRVRQMITLTNQAGYDKVSFDSIQKKRSYLDKPAYISYDVAVELAEKQGLTAMEARRLTTHGGACHVPYGDWAMRPAEAVALIHQAGGVAVAAHPGLIWHDSDEATMLKILQEMREAGLDGIEVYHPYQSSEVTDGLTRFAQDHALLVTGGSDWHGPGRYADSDAGFGSVGVNEEQFGKLLERVNSL